MKITLVLLYLFSACLCFSQKGVKIGEKVPDVVFEKLVSFNEPHISDVDFNSKIVVIDFWATWCGPCIASFPELEKLQEQFKDEILIVTVTNDPEKRINKFLEKKSLKLTVVLDPNKEIAKYFPHRIIPHTVIIDKNKVLRATTTSSELNEDVIQKLINEDNIEVANKQDVLEFDEKRLLAGNDDVDYQVVIMPHQEGWPSFSNTIGNGKFENRRIVATNLSPQTLYEIAYQFPLVTRTVIEAADENALQWSLETNRCFDLVVPAHLGEKRFDIMKTELENYFGFKAFVEHRKMKVKVLKLKEEGKYNFEDADETLATKELTTGSGVNLENGSLSIVTNFLELIFNKPVFDDTGLKGRYTLKLPFYHENPSNIFKELDKLGFELVNDEKDVEVLVIKD